MQTTMFKVNGLTITGTKEQIDKYASDNKEFDYIKNSLEKISTSIQNKFHNETNDLFQFGRLNREACITAVGNLSNDNKSQPFVFMMYDRKNRNYFSEISVSELESLKSQRTVENIMYQMNKKQSNMVTEEMEQQAKKKYDDVQNSLVTDKSYVSLPINNEKKSLTSEKGFYVGDPALVLKDEILNKGVRTRAGVQTGIYQIGNESMLITHASNGSHSGHDIYSGTIGVIPLEFVDTSKIKALPSDSLDIRLGKNINVIAKHGQLHLAQGEIDTINTQEIDTEMNTEMNTQFNF